MRRQIAHMIKFKYIPFNLGKKVYKETKGKDGPLPGMTPTNDESSVVRAPPLAEHPRGAASQQM
jgi:hypothetical protein